MSGQFAIHNEEFVSWCSSYKGTKFHAVLCDPPYGLEFMGKDWDGFGTPAGFQSTVKSWGDALLPLLHPGAIVLMFGGTRMWHRLAAGMEDAGFELWDSMMWLYGSGFPKAHDTANDIDKKAGHPDRGHAIPIASTHLPAGKYIAQKLVGNKVEPYVAKETAAKAWLGYKTPQLKPAWEPCLCFRAPRGKHSYADLAKEFGSGCLNIDGARIGERFPANLILDETTAPMLDEHSRFFYCAKASRKERDAGCRGKASIKNNHPCVKPLDLCCYLATLILPPSSVKHRRLLVPFAGSGSEMIGGIQAGWDEVVGVEKDTHYAKIARPLN